MSTVESHESMPRPQRDDTRLLVRVAQLYHRMHLSQAEIGERLGLSRFRVGRMLDRALREGIVRIEVVHPTVRLLELEDALVARFGLGAAVVADVPAGEVGPSADDLARESVGLVAAGFLAARRPQGAIGVSWGRTMLALARSLTPGWTSATEIVQLNGATSRSPRPTGGSEIVERFAATSGAEVRLLAAPALVGSADLQLALKADPGIGETLDCARRAPTAIFGLGIPAPDSPHLASGFVSEDEQAHLREVGAVGDIIGRFVDGNGRVAWPELDERSVGLPLDELLTKQLSMGMAAGAGRGPIALAAIRAGVVNVLACDDSTAEWVLAHG